MISIECSKFLKVLGRKFINNTRRLLHDNARPVKLSFKKFEHAFSAEANKNPPLLIMHGLFGSKRNWHTISQYIHENSNPARKIYSLDARNYGKSPRSVEHTYPALAMDIKTFIEDHNLQKISFLGHSMGGRVGMYFALRYPQLLEKLIVADISPISYEEDFTKNDIYFNAMFAAELPTAGVLSKVRAEADTVLKTTIPDQKIRSFLLSNLVQESDGSFNWRIDLPALKENYPNMARFPIDHKSGLKYIGPTMFIKGEHSDFIKFEDHKKIRKLFPNAEFFLMRDVGHFLHIEKPMEFADIALYALNTI